ncbi:ATP-binding protein [Deefgea rivuli]|uniref:ATP-binding protein n=1 Tax=Deefgea rivuli TaxID=400948 RepID=UPI000485F8FB|nr:ATP-binding protein [Deefgea rivuli]
MKNFELLRSSSYYPLSDDGRLCPILDNKDLIYEFYISAENKKGVKSFCKNKTWNGKVTFPSHVLSDEKLKIQMAAACNSSDARKKIELHKDALPLHQAIWLWLKKKNTPLFEKVQAFCYQDSKGKFFIAPNKLGELFDCTSKNKEDELHLKYLTLAFAMLQREERFELVQEVVSRCPDYLINLVHAEENENASEKEFTENNVEEIDKEFEVKKIAKNKGEHCLLEKASALDVALNKLKNSASGFRYSIAQLQPLNKIIHFSDEGCANKELTNLAVLRPAIYEAALEIKNLINESCLYTNEECEFKNNFLENVNIYRDDLDEFIENANITISQLRAYKAQIVLVEKEISEEIKKYNLIRENDRWATRKIVPPTLQESKCNFLLLAQEYKADVLALVSETNARKIKIRDELLTKCNQIKIECCNIETKARKLFEGEIDKFSRRIASLNNVNELDKFHSFIDELWLKIKSNNSLSISELAKKIKENECVSSKEYLQLCELLVTQNKPEIAFILLQIAQNHKDFHHLGEDYELGLRITIQACYESSSNNLSMPLVFDSLCKNYWLLNLSREDVRNSELIEEIIITLIAGTLWTGREIFFAALVNLDAIDVARNRFPEFLSEILVEIIKCRPITLVNEEVCNNKENFERAIKGKIQRENGKFRHVHSRAIHFARFETMQVFPALESLWHNVSSLIKNKDYKEAYELVKDLDALEWYGELVSQYDKPLDDHPHFSNTIQEFIRSFVCKINEYVAFILNTIDAKAYSVSEFDLLCSLKEWAADDNKRIGIVNALIKVFKVKATGLEQESILDEILQSEIFIRNCPEATVWLSGISYKASHHDFISHAFSDLEKSRDFLATCDFLANNSAWGQLSVLQKEYDSHASYDWKQKYDKDLIILGEQRSIILKDNSIALSEFDECVRRGRLKAASAIINACKGRHEQARIAKMADVSLIIEQLKRILEKTKDLASESNMPEVWQESVYIFVGKIEKKIREIRRFDESLDSIDENIKNIEKATNGLFWVTENNLHAFEGVEYYLTANNDDLIGSVLTDEEIEKSRRKCPEIFKYWDLLAIDKPADESENKKNWAGFVKEFSKLSNLYHDENDAKKRFLTVPSINYTYPIFQTGFYKPQSEYLKRPLRIYLFRTPDVDTPALQRLDKELSAEYAAGWLHIVFAPNGYEKIQRYFKYDQGFKNFLLIDINFLYRICLIDKHDVPVRQALHASVTDLANSSPFVAQGYCHQNNNIYVGRKETLQKILNTPQAMIWGGRRIGKTSVLHALQNTLSKRGYMVAYVYVDLEDDGDPDLSIARKIAATLKLEPIKNITDFERQITDVRNDGQKVAFLIDEIDEYIKKSRATHGDLFPLATVLRQLVMDDSAKDTILVYSGYHQLYYEAKLDQKKRRVGHPFINIAQEIPIRDLTYDDVYQLVKTGFEEMLGISINPDVPRLIAERASRHPAFVQQFCRCLLEYVAKRRSPKASIAITPEDVEAVYADDIGQNGGEQAFIHYVNETLGYNLSHLGRAIVLVMMDLQFNTNRPSTDSFYSKHVISRSLNEWCEIVGIENPEITHFEQTIELLVMTNMLTQKDSAHDYFKFTYPTYADILRRLDKLNRSAIERSLQEYNDKERIKGILL